MKTINKHIIFILVLTNMSCTKEINTHIETKQVYQTKQFGFSQAVTTGNELLFISGQVGWNTNHELTGNRSFTAQLHQSFINIKKILEIRNSEFKNIVMMRIYVKQLDKAKRIIISQYIKSIYPNSYKPASTLIGVETLAREDLQIEVEIIAALKTK